MQPIMQSNKPPYQIKIEAKYRIDKTKVKQENAKTTKTKKIKKKELRWCVGNGEWKTFSKRMTVVECDVL